MKRKFWKIMNKKDINIDEQTECQDNMTDMNENVEEQAAEQATEATDTADADDNSDNSENPKNTVRRIAMKNPLSKKPSSK